MLYRAKKLKGFTLGATDGEIGSVEEIYFDDDAWTIRYLVVDTGKWLSRRKVLVSPYSLEKVNWGEGEIDTRLTRKQIEESPEIDANKPISRQNETSFLNYYGYPHYWIGPHLWGPAAFPVGLPVPPYPTDIPDERLRNEAAAAKRASEDPSLRSTKEVAGYTIEASDGDIGHVEDFVFSDDSWTIRYMVVDTRNWLPGKKVLVSPEWIDEISWTDRSVFLDMTRDAVKNSPEFNGSEPLTREYETKLHDHYQRSGYWGE